MHSKSTRKVFRRSSWTRHLGLVAASALVAGLLISGAAMAGELFEPVSAGELISARQSAPKSSVDPARQSFAKLSRAELAAHMAPLDSDRAPDRARRARERDGLIDMTLAPGVSVTLRRSDVSRVAGGGVIWSGDALGENGGTGSFLIEAGQVLGTVDLGDKVFKIEPMTGAIHRITEIDPREIPGDIVIPAPADLESTVPGAPDGDLVAARAKRRTTITYLVAYTAKARAASSNIVQDIRFAIAWANQAFKNSGAKIKYKLVKTMLARGYDEDSTTYIGNITDLRTGQAFKKVRKKRSKKKADLVSLIREGGAFCGVGNYVPRPSAATAVFGYSVTSRDCIPSTFSHEAGHNLGLTHDRFAVGGTPPSSEFNFGYVNLPALVRTIMAYNDECNAAGGQFCRRLQYFSTPKKKPQGNTIGIKKGRPGAADAAKQLNKNRKAVAAYF